MSTSFIDEYLVKLGASVDESGMQRFHQALREATAVADSSAASIAGAFFKTQTELVGGFAAIGGAAIGLVDKVAMADQSYRLFALHMYMSKDAARGLKVAMDALGEPLENLTWDKELRNRTHQLIMDQRAMAPNGDFEAQMRKVRDIRFEFTRMEVEGQYLAMHVVQDFMKALGFGPDELLTKLKTLNDWVTHNLPQVSKMLVDDFMPVWKDIKDIAKDLGYAVYGVAGAFQMLIGAVSGDDSLSTTTVTFESMARSLEHVTHWAAAALKSILEMENTDLSDLKEFIYVLQAVRANLMNDYGKADMYEKLAAKAGQEGRDRFHALHDGVSGTAAPSSAIQDNVHSLVDKYAEQFGVTGRLAHALSMQESGERQVDASGGTITSSTGAMGAMQLTAATARALGVDRNNAEDNVKGGLKLLGHLLHQYGDVPTAVAAYHEGEPKMNAILAGRATLSAEARSEVARVMGRMGGSGDVQVGSIIIHITKPHATNQDVGKAVVAELRGMQNKRVQRNLSEFQDLSWSY